MKKLYFLCLAIFAFSANETAPQKDANATVSASKILPAGEKTQTAPKNLIPSQSGVNANATAAKQNAAPQAAKKNANATKSENTSAAKTLATAKDINSTDSNASGAKKQDTNASGAKPASGAKKPDENASDPSASAVKLDTNAAKPNTSASQPIGTMPLVVPDELPIRPEILPAAPNTPPVAPPPLKNFTSRSFSLPSDALAIEQITVRYTDSDGASHEKIIDINRSINWQDDFIISASAKPALQRALDVSVTSKDPNLKNQTPQASATASFAPRLELPLETLKFDDGLKFVIRKDSVQLITADDFKSSDANASGTLEAEFWRQDIPLSGASFAVNIGGFSDINVTKEDGYYRIGVRSREGNLSIRRKDGGYLIYKN
ncbi:hypothetical protein [uncultured Campylobacter sp.]|uniref:hypothetical protein n=1 Tax=uncultured Campylobacter sp. TaxID=218934 RepID=UPI0026358CD1|nr:hypothetical protein [uncultured Campylobacter sp.]